MAGRAEVNGGNVGSETEAVGSRHSRRQMGRFAVLLVGIVLRRGSALMVSLSVSTGESGEVWSSLTVEPGQCVGMRPLRDERSCKA